MSQINANMSTLLPPVTAIRMVWALTGKFSDNEESKITATLTEAILKSIQERADKDEREREYVSSAVAAMYATLRTLDIIHKGRELNFKENEKLREAYLDSVRENLEFGKKFDHFIRSLPAITIGGAGGVTLAEAFGISGVMLWALTLALGAAGYIVNLGIVRSMRKRKQMLYVIQDYERSLYYDQYVTRVSVTLSSLYLDLDRIHKTVFGESYPVDREIKSIIEDILKGVRPTFCRYVHKHMREKKIKPELWTICETGKEEATKKCPYWEKI